MTEKNRILNSIKNDDLLSDIDIEMLSIDDLLVQDDTDTTYLEYICRRKDGFNIISKLEEKIKLNARAWYICFKEGLLDFNRSFQNEDVFFDKIDGDKTLAQLIIQNRLVLHLDFFSQRIKYHHQIIDYYIKYNLLNKLIISSDLVNKLFTLENGTFIVDKYTENGAIIFPIIKYIYKVSVPNLLNYCRLKSNYCILKYCRENQLLELVENNKTLLEILLDNNIIPNFNNNFIVNKKIMDILIKKNRIDLLCFSDLELLLSLYDENRSYLDLIIEEYKKGKNIEFEKIFSRGSFYSFYDSEIIAILLIKMVQNNIIGFVPIINSNILLSANNGKSILEHLFEKDKKSLLRILNKCMDLNDLRLVIALHNLGIDNIYSKIETNDEMLSDEIIEKYNDSYDSNCLSNCEGLLKTLKSLFYQDGKSDKGLVDGLIKSYRYLTSFDDYLLYEREIRQIIAIKRRYPDKFIYTKITSNSYFLRETGAVYLNNNLISVIHHETSHALHFYLANNYVPENYFEVIERVRKNPETINKVLEYSKKYNEIKKRILSSISKSEITDYLNLKYQGEKLLQLEKFLLMSKEEKKKEFQNDYSEEVLDTILSSNYSVNQFLEQRKKIEEDEMFEAMMRQENAAFIAIGDIIDAIYLGKFNNNVLRDEKLSFIEQASGHGIAYYSNPVHGFDEMIAEYGTIIKSKSNDGILNYLRYIVGDEVVDMIEDAYYNEILNSERFINMVNPITKK